MQPMAEVALGVEAVVVPLHRECQEPVMVTQPDDTIIVGCKTGASLGESNSAPDISDVEAQGAEPTSEHYPSIYAMISAAG